ncbi:MAG TPA: glycosyltransferase, partial [Rudaea sp.]|nr:glycosyltransferase [Rudaea sp.]
AVIPNGIDIPATVATGAGTSHRTLLYLGRIHPIKAVDRLLRAWRSLQDTHAAWRLRIVGSGEPEHVREIRDLAAELNLVRVEFAGALYGEDKHLAYVDSELFVLPSHSENFGMAVAEALAHGRAAVVGRGAPWAALESQHCGRWIANDPEPLAQALSELMSLAPDALATMGAHGRSWMARDFSWEAIAAHMSAVYHWSVHGGTVPDTVRLS